MSYRLLPLASLTINRANDRHGKLENETAAIAWLFNNKEKHMKNLAKDLVGSGGAFEPPLVSPEGSSFLIFDGNRRVTCFKVLEDARKAPSAELQRFFAELRTKWLGKFPQKIQCQVELDKDRVDDILYRRHTGTLRGIGQSTWDDRMKANFINRSGKGTAISIADEIEQALEAADKLPGRRKIPRSTMNRLLSSEAFRNRVGITVARGQFGFIAEQAEVLKALQKIALDLAQKKIVLGDVWDIDGKQAYLDRLGREGFLPTAKIPDGKSPKITPPLDMPTTPQTPKPTPIKPAEKQINLIPHMDYGIVWGGHTQRHRAIWEELQFKLNLSNQPNAISVLFRVLLEISVENYISRKSLPVGPQDKLAVRILKISENLCSENKVDRKYVGVIKKFQLSERIVSADTLNRYIHSPDFAPSPEHLTALWATLAKIIVECLNA